jgi:hypothetical protein
MNFLTVLALDFAKRFTVFYSIKDPLLLFR